MTRIEYRSCLALYFCAATSILLCAVLLGNQADLDLWGRLSVGALLEQTGHFPYRDVFSYTAPDAVWIDHEWGSGVIFYQLLKLTGGRGLQLLKLLLLLGVVGLIFLNFVQQIATPPAQRPLLQSAPLPLFCGAVLLLPPPLIAHSWLTIRCQLFTYLFYALTLLLLERFRLHQERKPRTIGLLAPVFLIWVNVHGGFAYGAAALGFYLLWLCLAGRRAAAGVLALVALACFLAALINPYGPAFHKIMLWSWALPRPHISEWRSVFVHSGPVFGSIYTCYWLFWIALGARAWLGERRQFPGGLLIIGVTGIEGLLHVKLLPLFAITAAMLGPELGRTMSAVNLFRAFDSKAGRHLAQIYLPVLLLCLSIPLALQQLFAPGPAFGVIVPSADRGNHATVYPADAARFILREKIGGNLWCPFDWGEFLLWTLYPRMRVSIDGRYEELYPHQVFDDAYAFYYAEAQSPAIALQYPTTHVIVPAEMQAVRRKIGGDAQWRLIYRDRTALLYERNGARPLFENRAMQARFTLDEWIGALNRFKGDEWLE